MDELFGKGGDKGWAGKVDFLDGIPLEAGCLQQEVMSPHHASYYQGKSPIPHDCEDPIPLPFLRIKPGARFEIALVARGNLGDEDAKSALRDAEKYLLQGLADMGLGAKTSSGYGLFEIEPTDEPASSTARGQARAEAATTGPVSGPATKKTIEGAVIDSFDSKTDRLVFKAPDGSSYEVSIRFCQQKFGINPGGLNHWRRERTPFGLEVEGDRVIGVYRH
jgi:hypothetical protein